MTKTRQKPGPKPMIRCLTPRCGKRVRARGLCVTCHASARKEIISDPRREAILIRQGRILRPAKRGPKSKWQEWSD